MQQLLTYGGSGYFPLRLVRAYIELRRLWRVPHAPKLRLPAWRVYSRNSAGTALNLALEGLRELSRAEHAQNT